MRYLTIGKEVTMANIRCYEEMEHIRGKDKYPNREIEEELIEKVFPKTIEELALKLSNVTAGFYGFTLKQVGQQCGWDKVNSISESLFRELGELKAQEAKESGLDIPGDTRALAMVSISAIYTSSPEYNFEFLKYSPKETVMRIFGACRYFRIAKRLNIDSRITWPTLIPFFEGIAQHLGIECKVEMEVKKLEDDGTCDYLSRFTMI
jgi:hypothetical protein